MSSARAATPPATSVDQQRGRARSRAAISRTEGAGPAIAALDLQRLAGNRAVTSLLTGDSSVACGAGRVAQASVGRSQVLAELGQVVQRREATRTKAPTAKGQTKAKESKKRNIPSYVRTIIEKATGEKDAQKYLDSLVHVTFLGKRTNHKVHPDLKKPVANAEGLLLLKALHLGLEMPKATESLKGGRAKATTSAKYSYHLYGLALDIEYTGNPWIRRVTKRTDPKTKKKVRVHHVVATKKAIRNALRLVDGKSLPSLRQPSGEQTVEATLQHYDRLAAVNTLLLEYFNLQNLSDQALQGLLNERQGLSARDKQVATWRKRIADDIAAVEKAWARQGKTKLIKTTGFMSLKKDIVEALVTAGFHWGGWFGDMMHFDWRYGEIGTKFKKVINQIKGGGARKTRQKGAKSSK